MRPTQRTLALIRKQGFVAQVVEHIVPRTFIRRDLFNIIDILAINTTYTIGIQTTSGSNVSARIAKAIESEQLRLWLSVPSRRFIIHGWRKLKSSRRWECREIELTISGDGFEITE